MAELVGQNSDNLLRLALLDQGIIDDDVLLPRQTEEVGIAVSAALATIDDVQLVQRKLQPLGQVLNALLQLAGLQGRELVEERKDGDGIDGNHEDLESSPEQPQVVEKLISGLLNDGQECGQNRRSEDESQQVRLDDIGHEELGGLLVEAELFLQHERMVDAGRQ